MHKHSSGCCGCSCEAMGRRSFLAAVGGTAVGAATLAGCATTGERVAEVSARSAIGPKASAEPAPQLSAAKRVKPAVAKQPLAVQPVLAYALFERHEATSWRPWGGLHTQADVDQEAARIRAELDTLNAQAEFPMEIRPLACITKKEHAAALRDGDADVMLIFAAQSDLDILETLIVPSRANIVFVRHRSGPVYLWYETVSCRLLRKTVDEQGQPGLTPEDVVVDEYDDVLWRLRSLYALKHTVNCPIIAIGSASGWGAQGGDAVKFARDTWKMDIQDESYEDLAKRIQAAKADPARLREAEAAAKAYLGARGVRLETQEAFVSRAFLLKSVFDDLLAEAKCQAITVNNCMSTIMPMSETTACLTLSLLNDAGVMAFCESDFAVIPSGVLLHHIASTPVFLQDPTYPHHGVITLAHCTAPRKMDGLNLEPARILTHYESDYGAAPKVDMRLGQEVTVLDPDFLNKRWIGFRGTIVDNPFLDICRSQIDVGITGDWRRLMAEMKGFHWMLAYGNHLRETGYALRRIGIGWYNLSDERTVEA